MAIKKQIKELEIAIAKAEAESQHYWIGKWAKSIQINRMKARLVELKKELKPNHHDNKKADRAI